LVSTSSAEAEDALLYTGIIYKPGIVLTVLAEAQPIQVE
jgi:hypothetical protein